MPRVFTLSASTIDDPDVQLHRMGTSNNACFIEDMSMLRRKDVIAQLVDEHLDRLSQTDPINENNVSGLQRFDFISVLVESDLLFKTNGLQTVEVNGTTSGTTPLPSTTCYSSSSARSRC